MVKGKMIVSDNNKGTEIITKYFVKLLAAAKKNIIKIYLPTQLSTLFIKEEIKKLREYKT